VISSLFHTVFYDPIYNALVALMALIPGGDVGVAVIILTIVIRLVLLPFSLSAARTQRAMKELEPRLKELKDAHKGNKEKETLETLALYREARVNPFSSLLIVIIQIPVLLALYWVFAHESFTELNRALLYGFTPVPGGVSLEFLGLVSVVGKSIVLAVIAGVTQLLQARLALAGTMKPTDAKGFQGDFQRALSMQLQYVFPIFITVIAYTTSGAVALYFITTNIAGIWQEWHVRRKLEKEFQSV
jgi:YidC/Oxa1 family membrane protein insertase